jgi:hypothetical protein
MQLVEVNVVREKSKSASLVILFVQERLMAILLPDQPSSLQMERKNIPRCKWILVLS